MKWLLIYWLVGSMGVGTGTAELPTIEDCKRAGTDVRIRTDELGGNPKAEFVCVEKEIVSSVGKCSTAKPYALGRTAWMTELSPSSIRKYQRLGIVRPSVLSDGSWCFDDADVQAIRKEKVRRRGGEVP